MSWSGRSAPPTRSAPAGSTGSTSRRWKPTCWPTSRPASPRRSSSGPPRPRHPRRLVLALGSAALAIALAAFLLLAGSGADRPSRAYGADLVRFAESTPLLLLEGPGWRVQNVNQNDGREGLQGSMEFVTGRPIPYESIRISGNVKTGERESGMFPPAVRQRRVELVWSRRSLADEISRVEAMLHPHGRQVVKLPVLGTTATVDTRAEFYVNQGGPGNRQMIALWSEAGFTLELRAAVPDLAGFEERLDWLAKVDSQAWLDAMPAKVVKAADHDAAVREMLQGIPTPETFSPGAGPRRRPDHQPLPGRRRRHRRRLLPLVPAVGRGAPFRRQRQADRSRAGDGERQAVADPA